LVRNELLGIPPVIDLGRLKVGIWRASSEIARARQKAMGEALFE
jgi:hypothetical protein